MRFAQVAILLAALRANPDSEPLLEAYLNTVQDQLDPDRLAVNTTPRNPTP